MLHERWKDYKEKEIYENSLKKCSKCKYAVKWGNVMYKEKPVPACNYMLITGQRRGCRPEDCKYYKEK